MFRKKLIKSENQLKNKKDQIKNRIFDQSENLNNLPAENFSNAKTSNTLLQDKETYCKIKNFLINLSLPYFILDSNKQKTRKRKEDMYFLVTNDKTYINRSTKAYDTNSQDPQNDKKISGKISVNFDLDKIKNHQNLNINFDENNDDSKYPIYLKNENTSPNTNEIKYNCKKNSEENYCINSNNKSKKSFIDKNNNINSNIDNYLSQISNFDNNYFFEDIDIDNDIDIEKNNNYTSFKTNIINNNLILNKKNSNEDKKSNENNNLNLDQEMKISDDYKDYYDILHNGSNNNNFYGIKINENDILLNSKINNYNNVKNEIDCNYPNDKREFSFNGNLNNLNNNNINNNNNFDNNNKINNNSNKNSYGGSNDNNNNRNNSNDELKVTDIETFIDNKIDLKDKNEISENLNYNNIIENIKSIDNNNNNFNSKIQTIKPLKFRARTKQCLEKIYLDEIDLYDKQCKLATKRNFIYMDYQIFLQPRMRKILIDWILEIIVILNFKRSTFHLTIILMDCFLSNYPNLQVNKLQLTGVTCLVLASKFEVIHLYLIKNQ
jgi:hypothetical protein